MKLWVDKEKEGGNAIMTNSSFRKVNKQKKFSSRDDIFSWRDPGAYRR